MPQPRPDARKSQDSKQSRDDELSRSLSAGIASLELALPSGAAEQLLDYVALLAKWNRAYNLTAVRDPRDMVVRHLLDSLAVLPWVAGGSLIDIGSGPGIPGIPLAIARPDLSVTLVDSNLKMTRFAEAAVRELGLDNVRVVRTRVEALADVVCDQAISRAFASVADFLKLADHVVRPGGRFLAMKGRLDPVELEAVPKSFSLLQSHRLDVSGLDAERHLLVFGRSIDAGSTDGEAS